jgi:hypothetical protein
MSSLQIHVAVSLVAIASSFVVIGGLVTNHRLNRWTAFCLLLTVVTTLTGLLLLVRGHAQPLITSIVSLVVLAIALFARYGRGMVESWRGIYVVTLMIALYLNVFILIVQMFHKLAALKPYASKLTLVQVIVALLFIASTVAALRKFRPGR